MASQTVVPPTGRPRVQIRQRTLRRDRWWVEPTVTVAVLVAFIAYSTFRAFFGRDYYSAPYLSPFYSPCLSSSCGAAPHLSWFPTAVGLTPAIYILLFPLGFRLTCYYYRKAYYRSFWQAPPACAVVEPHQRYTGETRFPLVLQNVHRYFWAIGLLFNALLTWDAVIGYDFGGAFGIGLGSLVLTVNAVLLWGYSLSCHSCRHIVGGRLRSFGRHPLRYRMWTWVSRLNVHHQRWAWASLIWVALSDAYVFLVAAGAFHDPHWVS